MTLHRIRSITYEASLILADLLEGLAWIALGEIRERVSDATAFAKGDR